MEGQFDRFKGFPWFDIIQDETVFIGGAGGIGSWLSFFLARSGVQNIVIFDDDQIESHNTSGQMFKHSQIGLNKVKAVTDNIYEFTGKFITSYVEKINEDTPLGRYFFSAFDNMEARKNAFSSWLVNNLYCDNSIFIDGRLLGEQLQIFCIKRNDSLAIEEYQRDHLFDDSEVEEASCTTKQTTHSAAMIATHMTAFFTNHLNNIVEGEENREVPFYYEYLIPGNLTVEEV